MNGFVTFTLIYLMIGLLYVRQIEETIFAWSDDMNDVRLFAFLVVLCWPYLLVNELLRRK